MRAMRRTRPIALLAILAVAWVALLPFTAAARLLLADEPVPYCHRLSVTPQDPSDPAEPGAPAKARKGICPFCSSSVLAAAATPLPIPSFVPFALGLVREPFCAAVPYGVEVEIPLSRAPPARGRM
jgi:hypothetical protein